jgi:hypothetical protein
MSSNKFTASGSGHTNVFSLSGQRTAWKNVKTRLFTLRLLVMVTVWLLLTVTPVAASASQPREITTEQWHGLTSDKAFNYKNDREKAKKAEPYKVGAFEKLLRAFLEFFGTMAGRAIVWGIIIIIVCYIIYRIFFGADSFLFGKGKKSLAQKVGDEEGDGIDSADYELLLEQAVKNNDARLAVRYSYMYLLQLLQDRELIKFRIDKTNYEYYSELSGSEYRNSFRQLSRQYEYAWYGKFNVPEQTLKEYLALFDNLKKQLKR